MDFTTTQLIADLKRNGSVPTNQNLYDDSDFCAFMADCQKMILVPQIMACREEFFVVEKEYSTSDSENSEGKKFLIPSRAIGNRVRMVEILDQNGKVVRIVQLADPKNAVNAVNNANWNGRQGFVYFFENNNIVLTQKLSEVGQTLRVRYYRRPNQPVSVERCGKVLIVAGNVLTLDNAPTEWVAGTKVDVIHGDSPFDAIMDSEALTAVSGFDVTIADATGISVGDYVCFEGETAIPQLPYETHSILVQYALAKVLRGLGNNEGAQIVDTERGVLQKSVFEMIAVRDDASAKKIVSNNGLWNSDYTIWRW